MNCSILFQWDLGVKSTPHVSMQEDNILGLGVFSDFHRPSRLSETGPGDQCKESSLVFPDTVVESKQPNEPRARAALWETSYRL